MQREPFSQDAELLFQAIDTSQVVGYVTATTLTDIFYISRKHTLSIDSSLGKFIISTLISTLTALGFILSFIFSLQRYRP